MKLVLNHTTTHLKIQIPTEAFHEMRGYVDSPMQTPQPSTVFRTDQLAFKGANPTCSFYNALYQMESMTVNQILKNTLGFFNKLYVSG